MKVIRSIAAIYEEQQATSIVLKKRVDEIFGRIKKDTWHYFSRIKQLESFALKLETGRFASLKNIEDFFACTLVVENLDQINRAIKEIQSNFTIESQRPKNPKMTHKESHAFPFDDLRLYAKIKQSPSLPAEPITDLVFEIQIKTFLQHAWTLATHDLIYKSDEINWPKERIAYQIKATLEQAEVTISGVNTLITLPEVLKDTYETIQQKKILKFYKESFHITDLPKDLVRLCKNTKELLDALSLTVTELKSILKTENAAGRGVNTKNLSPYLLILQSIINQRGTVVADYISMTDTRKFKILLPDEIDISSITLGAHTNAIVYSP